MKTRFSPRFLVAALALSLGLASNGFAMPRGEHHSHAMEAHGHEMMMHGDQGMARLHDNLKLDAKQEALWQAAAKFSNENFAAMREHFRKQHEEMKTMLAEPNGDLRAIMKRMDNFRSEGQKLRNDVRERWLSVYDTLNPEQKEKARLFFKAEMERKERFGERRGDHHKHGQSQKNNPDTKEAMPKN